MTTPVLHIKKRGVGTVYLSLPVGGLTRARGKFLECIDVLRRRPGAERPLSSPAFLLLTGQADFTARLEVDDFRSIVELGFPEFEDPFSVYNWVFSVAYDENESDSEVRIPVKDTSATLPRTSLSETNEPPMHFIVHARVLRSFYASKPIESEAELVRSIRQLFRGVKELSIETSIGWSDLIVRGAVTGKQFPDLLTKLIAFNTFKAGAAECDSKPLFTRTLTLFGYEWSDDPQRIPRVSADVKALIFVRSHYGELHEAKELVEETIPGAFVRVTDGKLDLVGEVQSIQPLFFVNHSRLAENHQISRGAGKRSATDLIQKLETHLLFGQQRAQDGEALILPHLELAKCKCATELQVMTYDTVTITLEHALRNVYVLFQSALNDPTNCCDMRPAILACHWTLHVLVGLLNEALCRQSQSLAAIEGQKKQNSASGYAAANHQHAEYVATEQQVLRRTAEVRTAQRRIESWVMISERVMRQRTIGSFDEFLGQSDRALFYRGGAQKMLFLADCLMNDFYAVAAAPFIAWQWSGSVKTPERFEFATIYDAIERIESVIGTGFVRVPARNIFKLAAVIPDLWHEVGTHIFHQMVLKDPLDLYDPRDRDIWRDLGDHFGDLIVWIYGFNGDFVSFARSLLQSWHESFVFGASNLLREILFTGVLVRLMFVLDMKYWLLDPLLQPTGKDLLDVILFVVLRYYPKAPFSRSSYGKARASWASDVYQARFNELRIWIRNNDVEERIRVPKKPPRDFDTSLESFDENEDLNRVFCEMFSSIQDTRPAIGEPARNDFGPMAALGRSAVLEYHRRLRPREHQLTAFERDLDRFRDRSAEA